MLRLINRLKFLGKANFVLSITLSLVFAVFLFSFLLYLLDVNDFFMPTIIILVVFILFLLPILVFVNLKLFDIFVLDNRKLEKLLFSDRKFVVDSIEEICKKGDVVENYFRLEEIQKRLFYVVKRFALVLLLVIFALAFFIISSYPFIYKVKDFLAWLLNDVKVTSNRFVSSDIPLRLTLEPNFRGVFFVSIDDRLTPFISSNSLFYLEIGVNKDNKVKVFSKKYGIYKFIKDISFDYISDFVLIDQRVEVHFGSFKISSYDYLPSIAAVKGSIVKLYFDFSSAVSNVDLKRVKGVWSYLGSSNKVVISVPIFKSIEGGFYFYDNFGRDYKIDSFSVVIKTNDIPSVIIKYPEKDLTISASKIVLEGYGEVIDEDEILSTWMEVYISNTLNGFFDEYVVYNKNSGFSFEGSRSFSFSFDSSKVGVLPGDYVTINIISKDIYGAMGRSSRSIYFPTFSQLARSFKDKLNSFSSEVYSKKEELSELKYKLDNQSDIDASKLSQKLSDLKNFISNVSQYSKELKEIYENIDRTVSLYEEFQRLENISKKLNDIINDGEFNDILRKLSSDKSFHRDKVENKVSDVQKELTKLEMEINRLSEFKDIIKTISDIRNLEKLSKDAFEGSYNNLNDFEQKLREFLNSEEFNKLSEGFKSSFKEKVKGLENKLKEKTVDKKSIEGVFKDLDFEVFKEVMRQLSELQRKQKEKFWDIYFKVLSSQVKLTKSRDNIEILGYRFPKIDPESMKSDFKNVNDAIKDFRIAIDELLLTFSKDPSLYDVFSEIEEEVVELGRNFNLFTDAVSSGITYSVVLSIDEMVNRMSSILVKMLDLLDKMNKGMNIAPSGVSLSELIQMYKEISKLLSEMMNGGRDDKSISKLERMLKEAIEKARGLEAKNPGDNKATSIREELEDILNKMKQGKLDLAIEKVKNVDFNLLEYQRGMFEKGISEKREAERPKKYSVNKVDNILEDLKVGDVTDPYLRNKYLEIMNKYKKLIENY